jgi:hypothetical protein
MSRQASSDPGSSAGDGLLAGLLTVVAGGRPGADARLISRAYHVAAGVHAGQMRKSGDPYITHPVAVAAILAQAGADDQTLCAALLHDTLESPGYTDISLRGEFGTEVAELVTGVVDLDAGSSIRMPEGPVGMSMAEAFPDSRVVMIKLADRLHNLRTAAPLTPATRLSKSRDTLEVLVPLAAELGLDAIRAELEDLAAGMVSRHGTGRASASGRLLAAAAALLPATARSRWRDEWAGELSALPTSRQRGVFAARTLVGLPRLAATLRRPRRSR